MATPASSSPREGAPLGRVSVSVNLEESVSSGVRQEKSEAAAYGRLGSVLLNL